MLFKVEGDVKSSSTRLEGEVKSPNTRLEGNIRGGQARGSTDYEELTNKPSINEVELIGDKTSSELGLQDELVSGENIKTLNDQSILGEGNISIVVPTEVSAFNNDVGYMHVIDLGDFDGDEYDWDYEAILNEYTDPGFYHLTVSEEVGIYFYVERLDFNGTTLVSQRYWTTEETARYLYYRSMTIEDGEIIETFTDMHMTFADAYASFATNIHNHFLSVSGTQTVWQYLDSSSVQYQLHLPQIIYRDTNLKKYYVIDVYTAQSTPQYRFMRVTDISDGTCVYQRSGTLTGGQMAWGSWYKFTGTAFTPQ